VTDQDQLDHLRGIIRRNKDAFDALKADANRWRDRALRAEAMLEEARRRAAPAPDPLAELLGGLGIRR
jgi:chromosome segregation ATPase